MKTLKESLLDKIDDTLDQGDSYIELNKELKTLHTLKHTKWSKTSDGDYIYIFGNAQMY